MSKFLGIVEREREIILEKEMEFVDEDKQEEERFLIKMY